MKLKDVMKVEKCQALRHNYKLFNWLNLFIPYVLPLSSAWVPNGMMNDGEMSCWFL